MEEATGYRQRIIVTAEGDASRFKQVLAEYSKAPEVTRSRMYLETVQQVYANTSKVMMDSKGSGQPALPSARQADAGGRRCNGCRTGDSRGSPAYRASIRGGGCHARCAAADERSAPGDARTRGNLGSRERGER
jgi:membrane protease subunit HflK